MRPLFAGMANALRIEVSTRRRQIASVRTPILTEISALQPRATLVISDSGGIQNETYFLGIPCLTVLDITERRAATPADAFLWHATHNVIGFVQSDVRTGSMGR